MMRLFVPLALAVLCLVSSPAAHRRPFAAAARRPCRSTPRSSTPAAGSFRTLEQQHFEIFDDLKPQELTLFKSDVQPITVVVMLDTSGSMTFNLDLLKVAAEQFVLRLLPTTARASAASPTRSS